MKTVNWGTQQKVEAAPSPEFIKQLHLGMNAVLEYRLTKGLPLKVVRPLTYPTSAMDTQQDEDDDGFYQIRKSQSVGKFIDIEVTIPPGTELLLKALDTGLNEFVLIEKGSKKEHTISFVHKELLMSQTDIFDTVKAYLQSP